MIRKLFIYGCCMGMFINFACKKEQIATGTGVYLFTSQDTIKFDTVFTSTVQITQSFKIFNNNTQPVQISRLTLRGGDQSAFKINVNGTPGTSFNDILLQDKDSIYVFVTVKLPASAQNSPFNALDSIEFQYNGQTDKVLLSAVGQNAFFLQTQTLQKDTTWTSARPIVLMGDVHVGSQATLHIEKGTRIYSQLNARLWVDGRLLALGGYNKGEQILFTNNRLDRPYSDLPGSWGGIVFGRQSQGNKLQYVTLRNAINGITDTSRTEPTSENEPPNIMLEACQIGNASKQAVLLQNSTARIINCLLYNSGIALRLMGGRYDLTYSTIASYSNDHVYHTDPGLYLAGQGSNGEQYPLQLTAVNNIIYGDNTSLDELYFDEMSSGKIKADFQNCLLKAVSQPAVGTYKDCIWNEDPGFAVIDNQRFVYDFRVLGNSAAVHQGQPINIQFDLNHELRSGSTPTIGCLEFKD